MREEKIKYERLSKRALGCMYVSTVTFAGICRSNGTSAAETEEVGYLS